MRIALLLLPLALVACDKSEADPRLALCVSAARQAATNRGSVRMVHFEATPKNVKEAASVGGKALIDFDAANSYDGKRRASGTCEFAPHPATDHKGSFLLTSAVFGTIRLTDQQLAEANALDGSSRAVMEAINAAEMLRAEKTGEPK